MIDWLIARGVSPAFAKPLLIGAAIVLAVLMLSVGKCSYDRSVIRNHTNEQAAETAKADRKADATAADQRRLDDARANTERTEITDAIETARATGADPRAAFYECVRLQQAARKLGKPPAAC